MRGFICDFYCHALRLVIEIDGGYHDTGPAILHDAERTRALELHGVTVRRIKNKEVCRERLVAIIRDLERSSPSRRSGEGDRG
jgi:very-short-patch-repair endonuclease